MLRRPLRARTTAVSTTVGVFIAIAVFVGMKLASADPGGPPTRNALTFAGVLRDADGGLARSGDTTLSFVFAREDGSMRCASTVLARVQANGAFSVPVPLSSCPLNFFDGRDVQYDIKLGDATTGEVIASNVPITPVPYARFADLAGPSPIAPTVQLPSGTLYTLPTTPRAPLFIRVRMSGGGGGGAGISASGMRGAGGLGGVTSFGPIAAGGGAGASGSDGAAGGTPSATPSADIRIVQASAGGTGGSASNSGSASGPSGSGGTNPFGGGANPGAENQPGRNAIAGTGGGGAGAGCSTNGCSGGGGAGAYVEAIITHPAASYALQVGLGGNGGTAGTGGQRGGNGAAGMIIVEEYYQ